MDIISEMNVEKQFMAIEGCGQFWGEVMVYSTSRSEREIS